MRDRLRKKVMSGCLCMALMFGMLMINISQVRAENEQEMPEEISDAFTVVMTTEDALAAGKDVRFTVSVTNSTDRQLNAVIYSGYSGEESTVDWGTLSDSVTGGEVTNLSQVSFEGNQTKEYILTGSIPEGWKETDSIFCSISANGEDNIRYSGYGFYSGQSATDNLPEMPGDDDEINFGAFEVIATPDQPVKAGEQITFRIDITNNTEVKQKLSALNHLYYQEYDNSETYPGDTWGVLRDISENKEYDYWNVGAIEFASGETKQFTVSGTIPSTWGAKSQITIVVIGRGEDGKWYYGQANSPDHSDEPVPDEPAPDGPVPETPDVQGVEEGVVSSGMTLGKGWELLALTDEELKSGARFKVLFDSKNVTEASLDAADKALIMKAAGEDKIALILDLTIEKTRVDDGSVVKVTELSKPMNITIQIPKEYRAAGRLFSVVRLHGGAAEVLKDLDNNPDTVTISSEKFSLYTLTYSDENKGTNPVPKADQNKGDTSAANQGGTKIVKAPRTADMGQSAIFGVICIMTLGIIAGVLFRKKGMI